MLGKCNLHHSYNFVDYYNLLEAENYKLYTLTYIQNI